MIALVVDDVDRNLGYMLGKSTCGCKGSAEIGEYLARLNREITSADKLPVDVFGLLARNEYQLGTDRHNDLAVGFRGGQARRIDAFERHLFAILSAATALASSQLIGWISVTPPQSAATRLPSRLFRIVKVLPLRVVTRFTVPAIASGPGACTCTVI